MSDLPSTGRQLRTEVTSAGELKLNLVDVPTAAPKPEQVVVRVEASPINPSDLGLLLGMADVTTATQVGSDENPAITAEVPSGILPHLKARWDESMPVGNEGGGVVVAAGDSPAAQALLGKTVGVLGGAMYGEYRTLHVSQCLAMHEGVTPRESASCCVNPLTA